MRRCPKCRGLGSRWLFTSSEDCPACEGTGQVPAEGPEKTESRGGAGSVTITVDPLTGSSPSDAITVTTATAGTLTITGSGTHSHLVTDATSSTTSSTTTVGKLSVRGTVGDPPPTIQGGGVSILTGSGHPSGMAHVPRGSLYLRDDGYCGSLWMKAGDGPDGWTRVEMHGGLVVPEEEEPEEPDLLSWAIDHMGKEVEQEREWLEAKNRGESVDRGRPAWQCGYDVPVFAPVFPATLADIMSLLEQEDHDVHAFVTSARDFADVRKWPADDKVKWEGRRVWLFGVEILRSSEMPVGYFMAVSRAGKAAVASITRP